MLVGLGKKGLCCVCKCISDFLLWLVLHATKSELYQAGLHNVTCQQIIIISFYLLLGSEDTDSKEK
jgi:hypothetical protein